MKSNRIAWLGLASLVGGATVAAACSEETSVDNSKGRVCGDGIQFAATEECDDGNTDDNDDCTAACRINQPDDGICNENKPDDDGDDCGPEECENGAEPPDCEQPPPKCGNGDVDEGEDCDEWAEGETKKNSETCDIDCTAPDCDDSIQNNAAGECCANSGEFPCMDEELLAKQEAGDPNWCLCASSGNGGSGGGSTVDPCDGFISVAGYVVSKQDPANPAHPVGTDNTNGSNIAGISSVWNYAGQLGVPAGNELCAAIGGDHVCEWDEVVAAAEKGELSVLPPGQSFWIHRTASTVMIGATPTAPGPGGRCNDWTYPTNHISDSEVAIWTPANPAGLAAGWQQVTGPMGTPTNLYAFYDNDTIYTGNPGDNHQGAGLNCGGQGAPTGSDTTKGIGLVCCYAACEE
jgi:cysteine-rich repeat protein